MAKYVKYDPDTGAVISMVLCAELYLKMPDSAELPAGAWLVRDGDMVPAPELELAAPAEVTAGETFEIAAALPAHWPEPAPAKFHLVIDNGAECYPEQDKPPHEVGLQLGAAWDDRKANLRLGGSLGSQWAIPLFATAEIEQLPATRLAFAWVKTSGVPLILGQTNFFMEFDVCFYRSRFEFEVTRASSAG